MEDFIVKPVFVKEIVFWQNDTRFPTSAFVSILLLVLIFLGIAVSSDIKEFLYFIIAVTLLLSFCALIRLPSYLIDKKSYQFQQYDLSQDKIIATNPLHVWGTPDAESIPFDFLINIMLLVHYSNKKQPPSGFDPATLTHSHVTVSWKNVFDIKIKQSFEQKKYNLGTLTISAREPDLKTIVMKDIENTLEIKLKIENLIQQNKLEKLVQ